VRAANSGNSDGSVVAPVAVSDGGRRIAFASSADNLFFGDANQRADVFVIDRFDTAPPPPVEPEAPAEAPSEPFDPPAAPSLKLRVIVRHAPGGRVRLQIRAPQRGRVTIAVRGRVPDSDGRLRGPARLLATARKTVKKKGNVTVEVKLAKRYATVARREKKLDGRAMVTFAPPTGATLTGETSVRFSAPPKKK
jgi:hypothetical protein